VPVKCVQITYTSMSSYDRWPKWNDTLNSCQVRSKHLKKNVCLMQLS